MAEQLEDLLQPLDLALGLGPVLLERGPEVRIGRRLCHLGECLEDLTFGVIDVLQFMDEQVVQRGKLGHTILLRITRSPRVANLWKWDCRPGEGQKPTGARERLTVFCVT